MGEGGGKGEGMDLWGTNLGGNRVNGKHLCMRILG